MHSSIDDCFFTLFLVFLLVLLLTFPAFLDSPDAAAAAAAAGNEEGPLLLCFLRKNRFMVQLLVLAVLFNQKRTINVMFLTAPFLLLH